MEARLEIGKKIYKHELTINEAAIQYDINSYTAKDYMRLYRDKNKLVPMVGNKAIRISKKSKQKIQKFINYDDLGNPSKEQLIEEVIKARVEAERTKKRYTVKGEGQEKKFINFKKTNSK